MTCLFLARQYLVLNFLIAVAAGALFLLARLALGPGRRLRPSQALAIGYVCLLAAVILPMLLPEAPKFLAPVPAIQIWSAPSRRLSPAAALTLGTSGKMAPSSVFASASAFEILALVLALGFAWRVFRLPRDYLALSRIARSSFRVKRIGRVSILAVDTAPVPYSYWLPFRAWVVVPTSLLTDPRDLRIAISHELQHHRQRDTLWIHALELLKALCFPNPLVYWFAREISQLQEFACDERLVDRQRVSPQAYGSCLIRAAQTSLNARRLLAGTAGLAVSASGRTLRSIAAKLIS